MVRSGFKDPIAPKEGKKMKSPWDFRCPQYDERTSCYVDAGSHYGVGHRNPIGHRDNPKSKVPTMPFGRVETMDTDYAPPKMLEQEYIS